MRVRGAAPANTFAKETGTSIRIPLRYGTTLFNLTPPLDLRE